MTDNLIDYRGLYESSVTLLLRNVTKEIAVLVGSVGMVKLTRKNKIGYKDTKIVGVLAQLEGMFIMLENGKTFEFVDDDEEFKEFCKDPLIMITLLENIAKELDKKSK